MPGLCFLLIFWSIIHTRLVNYFDNFRCIIAHPNNLKPALLMFNTAAINNNKFYILPDASEKPLPPATSAYKFQLAGVNKGKNCPSILCPFVITGTPSKRVLLVLDVVPSANTFTTKARRGRSDLFS
jgi:hypothetical protein